MAVSRRLAECVENLPPAPVFRGGGECVPFTLEYTLVMIELLFAAFSLETGAIETLRCNLNLVTWLVENQPHKLVKLR